MPVTPDEIVAALQKLDSGSAEHWTDDGLPRVDVVRALAKDTSITRSDINGAAPGFSRAGTDGGIKEPTDVLPGELSADAEKEALNSAPSAENTDTDAEADAVLMTQDELREAMKAKIQRAEDRVNDARTDIRDAQNALRKAETAHVRIVSDYNRQFPPISAAQAIKDHLRRNAEHQAAGHQWPIEQRMAVRSRRPYSLG